jgi:hypothetical protein
VLEAQVIASIFLDEFEDEDFERARAVYQHTRRAYSREWRRLSRDPQLGAMFEQPTNASIVLNSCADLLTILGMNRLKPQPG